MVFLSSLRRRPEHTPDTAAFPWTLKLVRDLAELEFTAPVTFLVGENGCGKSTLLEGLAAGMDAVAAGRRDIARDPTLAAARAFAQGFFFVRRRHARTRLFLRAEDVFGFTGRVTETMADLQSEAREVEASMPEDTVDGGWRWACCWASAPRLPRRMATTLMAGRMAKLFWRCCAGGWRRKVCISSTNPKRRCRRRAWCARRCWR